MAKEGADAEVSTSSGFRDNDKVSNLDFQTQTNDKKNHVKYSLME